MEAPAPTAGPRSRILGHSSMFSFLHSLVGNRGDPRSSGEGPAGGPVQPLQEPGPPALLPCALSVAAPRSASRLSQHQALWLGTGGLSARTPNPQEVLRLPAQGMALTGVPPRDSPAVLGDLSDMQMEKGEEEETAGEARASSRASDRDYFGQALEMEQGPGQGARGPQLSPAAFTGEEEEEQEEEERLLEGSLRPASSKMKETPWNHLLTLYKQLQELVMAKFPLREDLSHDKQGEDEEMEEEASSFKLCVPGADPLQSPLHKTFRSTDTGGFIESELKKLLAVQRESRLWKMDSPEGLQLLAQPEATLEEATLEDGQHLLFEEMDESVSWPPQ